MTLLEFILLHTRKSYDPRSLILFSLYSDPFDPPSELNTTALTSTSIRVNIGPILQNQNGHIVSYSLYYAKVDTDGSTLIGDWTLQTSTTPQIDVVGLEFWTHYAFKAGGATIVGAGPNTTTLQIERTLEDRKMPFNFHSSL